MKTCPSQIHADTVLMQSVWCRCLPAAGASVGDRGCGGDTAAFVFCTIPWLFFFLGFSGRFLEIIYWSFVCLPFLTLIISIALLWRGGQVVTSIMLVVITSFIDILFQQVPKSFMPRNCMVWRLPLSMARCNIRRWMILNFNLIEFDRLAFLKGAWYWGLLPLQYRYPVWTV